jgi:hypothetical protein
MAQQRSIRTFQLSVTHPYARLELHEQLGTDVAAVRGLQLFSRQRQDLVWASARVGLGLAGEEVYPDNTGAHLFAFSGGLAPKDKFWVFQDRDGHEQPLPVGNRQLVLTYTNAPAAQPAGATAAQVAAAQAAQVAAFIPYTVELSLSILLA